MSFTDLLTPQPYRWPKKDDLPLRKAKDAVGAGPLAANSITRAVFIMDGFMHAGAALADEASKGKTRRYDLVYPMLFCYRHSIEVGLKWLISQYGPPLGVTPDYLNDTHNIWLLWQDCLKLFEACGANANDDELKCVEQIIKQFHDWDRNGMTFRYATKKNGDVAIFQYPDINLANLKDVMGGLANFFDGSDGWLDSIAHA